MSNPRILLRRPSSSPFFAALLALLVAWIFTPVESLSQAQNPGVQYSGSPANNDCTKFVVSGGVVQSVTTAGAACASQSSGANPTATAGPAPVNGSATTFMRSDAAPAVQLGTASVPGLLQGDGATLAIVSGIIVVNPANNFAWTGNNSHSGTELFTGTTTPTFATGDLFIGGIFGGTPSLGATGEGTIYLSSTQGLTVGGRGSTNDFALYNSSFSFPICQLPHNGAAFICNGIGVYANGNSVATSPFVNANAGSSASFQFQIGNNTSATEVTHTLNSSANVSGNGANSYTINSAAPSFWQGAGTNSWEVDASANFYLLKITGSTQCVHVNSAGQTSGTGADCGTASGANPTATAGPSAVNGSAGTFMRSDAAPAVQVATSGQQGIIQGDGATVTITAGTLRCTTATGTQIGCMNLAQSSQAAPANATVTAAVTPGKMLGFGLVCTITPRSTGRVRFTLISGTFNSSIATIPNLQMYYGTGVAPSNNANATGTALGSLLAGPSTTQNNIASTDGIVTGLTLGNAVWFDFAGFGGSSETVSVTNNTCIAQEF